MRLSLSIICAVVLAAIIGLAARPAPSAETTDLFLVDGVHIIDAETGEIARDRAILIEDGVITGIEAAGLSADGAQRIDGAGRYVIPGLWDSHVHSTGSVEDALGRTLPLFVAYGVTHVRDMASNLDRLTRVRSAIANDPGQIAPEMIAAGPLLIEAEVRWYGDIQRAIGGTGEPEAAVAELAEAGVDFLKAYTGLGAESYTALMAAAAERGLAVDGHVPDSMGLVGVIDAGQRTIEHLDISAFLTCAGGPDGPFGDHIAVRFSIGMEGHMRNVANFWQAIDWETCGPALERFGARGGALTPTLSMEMRERAMIPAASLDSLSDSSRAWCLQGLDEIDAVPVEVREAAYAAMRDAFMRIKSAGVTLLAGADAPNHCIVPGVSLAIELERMGEAGLTPLEVLQTATINPAQLFGWPSEIAVGAQADFVVLDANPLIDITAYRAPSGVFTQGRWLGQDALIALREAGRTDQAR